MRRYEKTETYTEPVVTKEISYGSLDEEPPELRDQFESLMETARDEPSGVNVYEMTTEHITVTDQDGTTRTYDSLDELPPDMRARIEEQMRRKDT